MRVVGVINKYLGQINQVYMMYDLIKKATNLQKKADGGDISAESEWGKTTTQLHSDITDVSESQGEIATIQQSAIDQKIAEDGLSPEDASDAVRDVQSDELELDQVEDVDAAQFDPAGDPIVEASVEEGGLDIGAAAGEEAVGELTVDMFFEDALVLVLL